MSDAKTKAPGGASLFLFDYRKPSLAAGQYALEITQRVKDTSVEPARDLAVYTARKVVSVKARRFHLAPDEVISQHPPPGAAGDFADQLPHIVLRAASTPWERAPFEQAPHPIPWMALLLLFADEIDGGAASPTRTRTAAYDAFVAPEDRVVKPRFQDIDTDDAQSEINFVRVKTKAFNRIAPALNELRFFVHGRKVSNELKPANEADASGFYSVVMANRLGGRQDAGLGKTAICHLVSLDGLEQVFQSRPATAGAPGPADLPPELGPDIDAIDLVSLAAWTFNIAPAGRGDFESLFRQLDGEAEGYLMRRPPGEVPIGDDPADAEIHARLSRGYVPLLYHSRSGEQSPAWYRGPLAPEPAVRLSKRDAGPELSPTAPLETDAFLGSDAAIIYDPAFGVFDLSLAAAWQAGRSAALADLDFCLQLVAQRTELSAVADELMDALAATPMRQLMREIFTQTLAEGRPVSDAANVEAQVDEVLRLLEFDSAGSLIEILSSPTRRRSGLFRAIRAMKAKHGVSADSSSQASPEDRLLNLDVDRSLEELLSNDKVRMALRKRLSPERMKGLELWAARLRLLAPLAFQVLVPDESLLPPESIRFFTLDENWVSLLLDGALSIGLESSRQTLLNRLLRQLIVEGEAPALKGLRDALNGKTEGYDPDAPLAGKVTGLLLRSDAVRGWPTLALKATRGGTPAPVLRLERLAQGTLLCLFDGEVDAVTFSEPDEGLRFGLRMAAAGRDVSVTLRGLAGDQLGRPQAGQLQAPSTAGATLLRPDDLVLCLRGEGDAGLATFVEKALGVTRGALTASQLALQLLKSPMSFTFNQTRAS